MVAVFTRDQLNEALSIMKKHFSKLVYAQVEIDGQEIFVVERGPVAAIVEIRAKLSDPELLKKMKL